eukprot:GHVN01091580.1.p4 GENE.GHVN01091580.1~~GHVN01091580.1.p4  ORF type:complete len:102 (-),score=29.86 GHVN01091580.1:1023-1328(-)
MPGSFEHRVRRDRTNQDRVDTAKEVLQVIKEKLATTAHRQKAKREERVAKEGKKVRKRAEHEFGGVEEEEEKRLEENDDSDSESELVELIDAALALPIQGD